MKKQILGYASLASLMLVAACGGGGSDAVGTTSVAPNAAGSVSMSIPLKTTTSTTRAPQSADSSGTTIRPKFIDGASNGMLTVYFDGVGVINFPTDANVAAGPGPSGTMNLNHGGTFTYASVISFVNNQPVATITGNFAVIPGPHKIGAVQTNGPCPTPVAGQTGPCIPENNGYVLAQGETEVMLQAGSNPAAELILRGVMQSAYICDDPGCNGSNLKVDEDGYYNLYVVVADENGTAITRQLDSEGEVVPFDNGSYQIKEQPVTRSPGYILTILDKDDENVKDKSFFTPGSDRASGGYGESIKVKCNNVGTTYIVAQLDANGATPTSPVTGFTVRPGIDYPQAGQVLSSVGVDQWFGNRLELNCTATGQLTIK